MKKVVMAPERAAVHHGLWNDNEEHNSAQQNYPGPLHGNPRQHTLQRVRIQQEEWNRRSRNQSSGSKVGVFAGRIDAEPEIKRDRQNRKQQDQHNEAG